MGGLALRSYRKGDEDDLVQQANNPKVAASVRDSFPCPYTLGDARRWIDCCLAEPSDAQIQRAISVNDRLIGGIGAMRMQDIYRYNAEVGYWIGEEYWGQGYATEALGLFTGWLFAHTDLQRLYAGVLAYNTASMRVLIKAGFRLEAIHVKALYKHNQYWDEHYFVKFRTQSSFP